MCYLVLVIVDVDGKEGLRQRIKKLKYLTENKKY
jgi:hypothetical protein